MSNKTSIELLSEAMAEIRQLKERNRKLEEANYNLQMAETATNKVKADAIREAYDHLETELEDMVEDDCKFGFKWAMSIVSDHAEKVRRGEA